MILLGSPSADQRRSDADGLGGGPRRGPGARLARGAPPGRWRGEADATAAVSGRSGGDGS